MDTEARNPDAVHAERRREALALTAVLLQRIQLSPCPDEAADQSVALFMHVLSELERAEQPVP